MMPTTLEICRSAFRADPNISPAERNRLLALLRETPPPRPAAESPTPPARIVRREEAAGRLGIALRTVDLLARQGVLKKVRLPGRQRAAGFREQDVAALSEGRQMEGAA